MFTCAHISTRQRVIALPPTNCNYRYDFAWPSLHFANSVKQFINFFFFSPAALLAQPRHSGSRVRLSGAFLSGREAKILKDATHL